MQTFKIQFLWPKKHSSRLLIFGGFEHPQAQRRDFMTEKPWKYIPEMGLVQVLAKPTRSGNSRMGGVIKAQSAAANTSSNGSLSTAWSSASAWKTSRTLLLSGNLPSSCANRCRTDAQFCARNDLSGCCGYRGTFLFPVDKAQRRNMVSL